MPENGEYIFKIDVFTPTTLPMKRLHEYIADLINIFGNDNQVHLLRVEEGSASPVVWVEPQTTLKVDRRLLEIKTGEASIRAMAAFKAANEKLLEDNASAILSSIRGELLKFPGRDKGTFPEIGPIAESGALDGEVIGVLGRDETIQISLRSIEGVQTCTGSKEMARELAKYLFEGKVRVFGSGKWNRAKSGKWELRHFFVDRFIQLKTEPLRDAVNRIRSIANKEVSDIEHPLDYLDELRH